MTALAGSLLRKTQGWRPPYEATIEMICSAFEIAPSVAVEQDAELVTRVLQARAARRAIDTLNDKKQKPTEGEAAILKELFDALDAYDAARGIPEEA